MSVTNDGVEFERLGHASVRVAGGDRVVYVDPWLEVVAGTPRDGDLVVVTHDDPDHYDPEAVRAVAKPGGTVAVYERVDTGELDHDGPVLDLPTEGTRKATGVGVRTLPAYNDPEGAHVDEDGDPWHAEGEVVGVVLDVDGTTVFFPSDTDFLPHHDGVSADVFLPPIGGHYTMDRHEAADFVRSVGPELTLPVHYDTFETVETDAEAFAAGLERDGHRVELF